MAEIYKYMSTMCSSIPNQCQGLQNVDFLQLSKWAKKILDNILVLARYSDLRELEYVGQLF